MNDRPLQTQPRRAIEDLLVGVCGFVTSLLTGVVLWIVEQKTGWAIYTIMYWFVIPAGALGAGFVAASGYYAGAKFFGHKPSRIFIVNVIAASLATFFLIHYLSYATLVVDGKYVSDYVGFTRYLDFAIRSTSMGLLRGGGQTGELGSAGYFYAVLQVIGFAAGGFTVYLYLTDQAYCENCMRYMAKKIGERRYTNDAEGLIECVNRVTGHISAGELARAVEAQKAFGNKRPVKGSQLRSEIQVRYCKKCGLHWFKFAVAKRSGSDWTDIPDLTFSQFSDQVIGS